MTCEAHGYPEPTLLWSEEPEASKLGIISCEWEDISDAESGIIQFLVSVGTTATDQSVLGEITLEGNANHFSSPLLYFSDTTAYYVSLRIRNGASLETILLSDPLYFDSSAPPVSQSYVFISPNSLSSKYDMGNFSTEPLLSSDSVICIFDTDVTIVVFEDTTDPETTISR